MVKVEYLIFDWGNTVMRDLGFPGPMKDWDSVENIQGIEDALKELAAGYKLIIATSAEHSDTGDMRAALKRGGVEDYFQQFFSSRELGAAKPNPEFFLRILKQIDCEPGQALSIGDKYLNDVVAAKRAGLYTVWFNEKHKPCDHPDADAVIHQMSELPLTLRSLKSLANL